MKLAGIVRDSIVDGVGIRDVIFTQGCPHKCKGCHNPGTWSPAGGYNITVQELYEVLEDSINDITISGGEPLWQLSDVLTFCEMVKRTSTKNIWLYTGYKFDELSYPDVLQLAKYVDVMVDGRFEEDKADKSLLFRGSKNQRLIDLKESVKQGIVVEWEDCV